MNKCLTTNNHVAFVDSSFPRRFEPYPPARRFRGSPRTHVIIGRNLLQAVTRIMSSIIFDPYLQRARRLSWASLILAILAVLPYLCWLIWTTYNILLATPSEEVFAFLVSLESPMNFLGSFSVWGCFSGLLFGLFSLLTGWSALRQLDPGEGPAERQRVTIAFILSSLAILSHFFFLFLRPWEF